MNQLLQRNSAFEYDLQLARKHEVRAFPSFKLSYKNSDVMLPGYQSYDTLSTLISEISDGAIEEQEIDKSERAVIKFIENMGSVVPVEIQTVFEFTDQEMKELEESISSRDNIRKVWAGNGYFLRPMKESMACDSESGVCRV